MATVISPQPWLILLDDQGAMVPNGQLAVYQAGTTTPVTVYADAENTPHPWPITLDSAGRIPGGLYILPEVSYKFVLHQPKLATADLTGAVIKSQDNVTGHGGRVNVSGSVPDSPDLPAEGQPGDAYISADDGHLWVWDEINGIWVDVGAVQGPPGMTGPPGPQGPPGPPGSAGGYSPHAATHQFGGLDMITSLQAEVITGGTLFDQRLSVNVLKHAGGYPGGIATFLRADGSFAPPPSVAVPPLHAASHRTGGGDQVALDGVQITTGEVADARISQELARRNAPNIFTSTLLRVINTNPMWQWYDTDGPVDGKFSEVFGSGGDFIIRLLNDAYSVAQAHFVFQRNGNFVIAGQLNAAGVGTTPVPAANITGTLPDANLTSNVALKNIDNNFVPQHLGSGTTIHGPDAVLVTYAWNGPANQRTWRLWQYGDGNFYIDALTDAGAVTQRWTFRQDGYLVGPYLALNFLSVGAINVTGAITVAGAIVASGTISAPNVNVSAGIDIAHPSAPNIYFRETAQPANQKGFRIIGNAQLLHFQPTDDVGTPINQGMFLHRGGALSVVAQPATFMQKAYPNSPNSGEYYNIEWDTLGYNTGGCWVGTTGLAGRFTALLAGVYVVTAEINFAFNAAGARLVAIQKNGGGVVGQAFVAAAPAGAATVVQVSSNVYMAAGEYLTVYTFQNSGVQLAEVGSMRWTKVS